MRYLLLGLMLILGPPGLIFGQIPNEICLYATPIPSADNYCSEDAPFTNVDAEQDPTQPTNSCFMTFKHAVWFSFVPLEPAAVIRVTGSDGAGTLSKPVVAVFQGPCGSLVQQGCASSTTSSGVVELTVGNLVIGQTYYIAVDGNDEDMGTFDLCINDFIPIPFPQADCNTGVLLCDKSSFQVESLVGIGEVTNEVDPNDCIQSEFASSWYKWTCDQSGTLTFDITPNNYDPTKETDDIDFAVYRLPGGLDDCGNKEIVRCMASGASGGPYSSWAICNGPTGLSESSSDTSEDPGCSGSSDNYVAALDMVSGESYVLLVLNYSQSGLGFSIDFGGTGTFLGPDVDFEIDAVAEFECDKTITFTDNSHSGIGSITSWSWNFGAGSNPVFSNTPGPHAIIYESFGDKIAALTIESDAGCTVTKVLDFYIEPCCEDFPDLDVDATLTPNLCYGDSTAVILGQGFSGNPAYSYSLDGVDFTPNPQFPNLIAGDYTLYIQDIKGCRDSIDLEIEDPDELIVYAGPDIELTLGDSVIVNGFYAPLGDVDIEWFGNLDWLRCNTCLAPIVRPFRSTDYTIRVTNEFGCMAEDSMRFFVKIIRPFYAPNAFSPNGDGINDWFGLFSTGIAIDVDEFSVYDRWGNLVYFDEHVPLNNPSTGWDGSYKGQKLNPDVFIWMAKVRYLDDVVKLFSGDVTLLK